MPTSPRRSVLYVPASNARALAKAAGLACDAVIVDLEDSVSPDDKAAARDALAGAFADGALAGKETVIRINALSGDWGRRDLLAAAACAPDAILLPKVEHPRDVLDANDALDEIDADPSLALWAMIETPRGILNCGPIAELGRDAGARLSCLVAGTNDLVKETGVAATADRRYLLPWLMQVVLAARAASLTALDGVANDFRDLEAFAAECRLGAEMGFDGKTLIHPAQIDAANTHFAPSAEAVAEARAIRDAFARPENANRGVITIDGRMVERLHLAQAERLLSRAGL